MRPVLLVALAALVTPFAAAPAAASEPPFQIHMDACTRDHGYDPEHAGSLADHKRHPNERAWAAHVYRGIETHLMPGSPMSSEIRDLVDAHRRVTEQVATGEMTRRTRELGRIHRSGLAARRGLGRLR